MKIAIDIDDVLADFVNPFIKYQKENYGMDIAPSEFGGMRWLGDFITREEAVRRMNEFLDSKQLPELPPIKGSKEGMLVLKEKHSLIAVTGRPARVDEITNNWINKHLPGIFEEVISTDFHIINNNTRDKGEICVEKNVELLIDDNSTYCLECSREKIKSFLFNQPWNENFETSKYPTIERVSSWGEIIKKLT